MEYTIYNESLVYYALRNSEGKYLGKWQPPDERCQSIYIGMDMKDCIMYNSLSDAKDAMQYHKDFNEIRKVKVIDIGEVPEEI